MITVKDLMENQCTSSPDGKHWEPALPEPYRLWWRTRMRDAWAVWRGRATAIRQTTKADLQIKRYGVKKRIQICYTCCAGCHSEHRNKFTARLHWLWLRLRARYDGQGEP